MQLNVDGGEWEESSHEQLREWVAIPGRELRHLSRNFVRAAWWLELTGDVPTNNGSHNCRGEVHEDDDGDHQLKLTRKKKLNL